jgi:broad specificity phosphatase PhoE
VREPDPRVVYLVRHARTAFNDEGRLRGRLDPALDSVGRAQASACAAALAEKLRGAPSVRVITSPLRRARETAEVIAAATAASVEVDGRLIDRDYGPWAGQPEDSVVAEWGSLDAAPGVETAARVISRARAVLTDLSEALDVSPVVIVAHDAVNRALLASLDPSLGQPEQIRQRTACWNLLHGRDGAWQVDATDQLAGEALTEGQQLPAGRDL